jgi:hypothetical protein
MTEPILSKKFRLFGDGPTDNVVALRAIGNRQWTARDAAEYRKATEAQSRQGYTERVGMAQENRLRTVRK